MSGWWIWVLKITEGFLGSFPYIGEDDLESFPEPDLHLALKTNPYDFSFWKTAFTEHKCSPAVNTHLINLPYSDK